MKNQFTELLKIPKLPFYIALALFSAGLALASRQLLVTETLYYNTFGEQLSVERIDQMLETGKKWEWLGYAFLPLAVLIRAGFTCVCMYVGRLLSVSSRASFGDCFNIALKADAVFVLMAFCNLIYFTFAGVDTLTDLSASPFSLLFLFKNDMPADYLAYPLGLINLFEVLYWLLLSAMAASVFKKNFSKGFEFVAGTYGVGLLLWALLIILLIM
ncbi:MAG: hypothetical protein LBC98_08250 [Prevotellaceae bacterium]|jgi:hypothetical protein|nr:hypothetical protein [Prevotellaceae bacterium]